MKGCLVVHHSFNLSQFSLSSFPNIHRPKLQGNLARKAINQEERRREEKKACLV